MAKRILIAAGGTGGHVFPGLAIAAKFEARGYEVQWLGTKAGMESRLVPVHGIKLNFFKVDGVRGKGRLTLLLSPFKIFVSVIEAWRQVQKINPDLVVGMGGFVAGPVGFVAFLQRRPLVIHEQNAVPGTTNKLLSKIATVNMSAFPVALKDVEVVGNPIRESLERISKTYNYDKSELNILVVGGSRGAQALNVHIPKALVAANVISKVKVRHQCGAKKEDETLHAYEGTNIDVEVKPFIDDMDAAMSWADVMICRAGALTVSEISIAGIPSILIPYPYAIGDHQTENARYLADLGAAEIVQETEFESGKLVAAIKSVISNRQKLKQMSAAALSAAKRHATEKFVDRCEGLIA